jgi:2-polyprenyl-3-methyl-5-hydroxy-6-metoxy-1,4-benzoquinol methylase
MTAVDRERWDAKYADREVPAAVEPPEWLVRHAMNLPPGRALDIACGLGHAAIWLAQRGWDVTAIDISSTGLDLACRFADQIGVHVNFQQADLDDIDLGCDQYDLITVFRFLDRSTLPQRITNALRPGGTLIYETFLADAGNSAAGRPMNPAFLLASGELPKLFPSLRLVEYAENSSPILTARFCGRMS